MYNYNVTKAGFWVAAQFILLLLWLVLLGTDKPYQISDNSLRYVIVAVGAIIAALGLLLGAMAVYAMGYRFTPSPEPRESAELVTTGIYRRVRHPMYGAVLLVILGASIAYQSLWGGFMVIVFALFFMTKSLYEESKLRQRYRAYDGYAKTTRRFLPYLW